MQVQITLKILPEVEVGVIAIVNGGAGRLGMEIWEGEEAHA